MFSFWIAPQYADGKDIPRGFPGTPNIPSAHQVSQAFSKEKQNTGNYKDLSVLFMTFGQFLDHDIGLSPHASCKLLKSNSKTSTNSSTIIQQ